MAGKIFVNYRRDDERAFAARVRDRLAQAFGASNVFMDVDNLLAGQRFDRELEKALAETDAFLAVMGPRWMELFAQRQATGERDYVREEIAGALKRGITVIPVLIEGAKLPRGDDLPEDMRELVLHQKHAVSHEQFGRDISGLVEAITFARKAARANLPKVGAPAVPWGWVAVTALAVVTLTYLGAYAVGVPVRWLGNAGKPDSFLVPNKAQLEDAARANGDAQRQKEAAAELKRKEEERKAAALKAEEEGQQREKAAAAESKPWRVTFYETLADGVLEPLAPTRILDLSPDVRLAQKALVHRDGGFEVVLSRRDLEEVAANPTGALEVSSALSVLTVELVRDRREVRVHVKNRTVSLADLSFEFWKGEGAAASPQRNCELALRIMSRRRVGRWREIGQGDVGLKHVLLAEYRASSAGADLGKAYVHLPESGAAFQIVNIDTDLETCYLEKPYVDVAEAAARKIKRTVGKPKAGFVAVVTADRALEGLSPAQQQQFAQFATELINRVGDLKNKKREGFGFSVVQGALGGQPARQLSQGRSAALFAPDRSPLGDFLAKPSNWSEFRLDDVGNIVRQTLDDLQIQNREAPVSILLVGPALDTRDVCRSGIKSLARQYGWLNETARQLMVVSIANGRVIDDAVSRRSLTAVDKSDLFSLFRCQPVKNEVEHIDYYVVQVPDVLRRDQSGPTVDYLAEQAKRLFKMQ